MSAKRVDANQQGGQNMPYTDEFLAAMEKCAPEMQRLFEVAWQNRDKLDSYWTKTCVAIVLFEIQEAQTVADKGDALFRLAALMWQKGYEDAPTLKFRLPEGSTG